MASVAFTSEASADLAEIFAFGFSRFGLDVADGYHNGLQATCDRLIDHPEIGAIYPGLRPPMRYLTYRRHHVFYTFDGEQALVVRILHHAMDASAQLTNRPSNP